MWAGVCGRYGVMSEVGVGVSVVGVGGACGRCVVGVCDRCGVACVVDVG